MSESPELQQTLEAAPEANAMALPAPQGSPGSLLRAARVASGLSVAEVTQSIKFAERQIEALERDDFDNLPGSTFVRGIIRSYAKLLHLDAGPLLAMLGQQLSQADNAVHAPEDTGAELPLAGERHNLIPLLALALTLAALGVALMNYFDWPGGGEKSKPIQAKANPGQVQPPAVRIEQPAAAQAVGALPPAAEEHQLIFVFEGKSWTEVKDATKKVIFAQNNLAGTRQVVSGKPPFDLVIGNAPVVQLQYGDRSIDLRPYTKVDVARFTLE